MQLTNDSLQEQFKNQKIAQDALREKYTALEMEHEKHIQDSVRMSKTNMVCFLLTIIL